MNAKPDGSTNGGILEAGEELLKAVRRGDLSEEQFKEFLKEAPSWLRVLLETRYKAREGSREESDVMLEAKVLNEIVKAGIVEGRVLLHETRLKPDELATAAEQLVNRNFIDVRGNFRDEDDVFYALFALRPSARRDVLEFLKEHLRPV